MTPHDLKFRVEPLTSAHVRSDFCCGVEPLDLYLHKQASQDVARRSAAVFVLTRDGKTVSGYYTLSSFTLLGIHLPEKQAKKLPSRRPVGVTLLGRMALSRELKGQRLDELLLMHALERAWLASQQVASRAVVVDAKDAAREFYLKYDFLPLPSHPNRLFLPMQVMETLFR